MEHRMGHHGCTEMPDGTSISYTDYLKPYLSVSNEDCLVEFNVNIDIHFCPWCGENILAERRKWLEKR